MPDIVLETERLVLRTICEADAAELQNLVFEIGKGGG